MERCSNPAQGKCRFKFLLSSVFQNPGGIKGVMQKVNPFKSSSQVTTALSHGPLVLTLILTHLVSLP